jgi:hypothetical protein
MVLLVNLKMLGEIIDPLGKDRHLDIGGAGIILISLVLIDNLLFFLCM